MSVLETIFSLQNFDKKQYTFTFTFQLVRGDVSQAKRGTSSSHIFICSGVLVYELR